MLSCHNRYIHYLKRISVFVMVLSVKTVHYSRDSTVHILHPPRAEELHNFIMKHTDMCLT